MRVAKTLRMIAVVTAMMLFAAGPQGLLAQEQRGSDPEHTLSLTWDRWLDHDEIGERLIYFSFMSGSSHTHPNPTTIPSYFSPIGQGKLDIRVQPAVPKNAKAFMEGCIFLHRLVDHGRPGQGA